MYYLEVRYPGQSWFLQCSYLKMRILPPPLLQPQLSVKEHCSPIVFMSCFTCGAVGVGFVKEGAIA